jgi:hypothetical protein
MVAVVGALRDLRGGDAHADGQGDGDYGDDRQTPEVERRR